MLSRQRENWLLVVLLILAGVSGWYSYHNYHSNQLLSLKGHHPDIIANDIELNRYNQNGKLEMTLTSRSAYHYPDDKTTDFLTPNLIINNGDSTQAPWHIQSKYARSWGRGDKILLYPEVTMTQEATNSKPWSKVLTSYITLLPNENLLETSQSVEAQQPNITIQGVGATYNSKTQVLQLLRNVHVVYVPRKP